MKYVKRGALDCFTVVACEKRAAFGAYHWVGYEKQAAFRGCYGVGGGKCGAFSCPHVGAYCIRPTNDPFMGRMIQMIDHRCAFLSPAGPFGGAYAIRPYPDGRKMIAVGVCHWMGYAKRGAMPAFYHLTWRRSCSRRPVLFRSCGG